MRRPLIAGTALALVLGVFTLGRHLVQVERTWNDMLVATETLRQELDSLPTERPVLWGDAESGDAMPHYREAVAIAEASGDALALQEAWLRALRQNGPEAAETVRAHFSAALSPALVWLRSGAHQTRHDAIPDWWQGFEQPRSNHAAELCLARAAIAAAAGEVAAGRDRNAVRLLLDAAQFGRDGAHRFLGNDESVGLSCLRTATSDWLEDQEMFSALGAAALDDLATGLERLDAWFEAAGRNARGGTVLAGSHMQIDPDRWDDFMGWLPGPPALSLEDLGLGWLRAWRDGFTTRNALAKVQLASIDWVRASSRCAELDHAAAQFRDRELRNRFWATGGSLARTWNIAPFASVTYRHEVRTRLRLLRMLLALRSGHDLQPLPDPFGGTLHAERRPDGSLRVWSDHLLHGDRTLELTFDASAPAAAPR